MRAAPVMPASWWTFKPKREFWDSAFTCWRAEYELGASRDDPTLAIRSFGAGVDTATLLTEGDLIVRLEPVGPNGKSAVLGQVVTESVLEAVALTPGGTSFSDHRLELRFPHLAAHRFPGSWHVIVQLASEAKAIAEPAVVAAWTPLSAS